MTINEVIATLNHMKSRVCTDDLETTIRIGKENDAIDFAIEMLGMLDAREAHFAEWAKRNTTHVCATCGRASDNLDHVTRCPIEEHYAVPLDGYCHLWEEIKSQDE